jgi:hypothetical protein
VLREICFDPSASSRKERDAMMKALRSAVDLLEKATEEAGG